MRLKSFAFSAVGAALLLAASASELAAQSKIGVIDFQQAVLSTADMKKQAAAMEAKYKARQDELEKLSNDLQDIQNKLQTATGQDAVNLQNDGARKQRDAQRLTEDLQTDIDYERQNILQGGAERMRTVVEKLRADKSLDLIVDVTTALAFDATLDLTSAAITAYDAAHPAN